MDNKNSTKHVTDLMIEPRPLIKKALELMDTISPGRAIDFGIGRGDETSYLLHHGYSVIAIDNFEEFLTEVGLREDTKDHRHKITTIHDSFEKLDWNTIPQVDIFLASFSLCFIHPDHFTRVFNAILGTIKPGGYFVGHLYTHLLLNTQVNGYFVRESQEFKQFLTEDQMKELFTGWDIKYFADARALYNEPIDPNQERCMYSVIAQKAVNGSS